MEIYEKASIGTIFLCKIMSEWQIIKISNEEYVEVNVNNENHFGYIKDSGDSLIFNNFVLLDYLDPKETQFNYDIKELLT